MRDKKIHSYTHEKNRNGLKNISEKIFSMEILIKLQRIVKSHMEDVESHLFHFPILQSVTFPCICPIGLKRSLFPLNLKKEMK